MEILESINQRVKIRRIWQMPNKWTFQMPAVAELLYRYVGDGKGWIDPFAGETSPAEITNDMNEGRKAKFHLDAFDFPSVLEREDYEGCLFDPPYSLEQISRSYEEVGRKSKLGYSTNGAEDPTGNWRKLKDALGRKIKSGGIVICFGWNSSGFGKKRGFEIIEILLLAHGGAHNDTIITVERKFQSSLF